jgi:hypothetical protein
LIWPGNLTANVISYIYPRVLCNNVDTFFEDVQCILPIVAEVVVDVVAVDADFTVASVPLAGNPGAVETIVPPKKQKRA